KVAVVFCVVLGLLQCPLGQLHDRIAIGDDIRGQCTSPGQTVGGPRAVSRLKKLEQIGARLAIRTEVIRCELRRREAALSREALTLGCVFDGPREISGGSLPPAHPGVSVTSVDPERRILRVLLDRFREIRNSLLPPSE